jgi:two-component system, OmpR family, sensor histidine kinase BaeS
MSAQDLFAPPLDLSPDSAAPRSALGLTPRRARRGPSIKDKVFLLLLIQSLMVVVAFFLVVRWAFDAGFSQYSNEFNDGPANKFALSLASEYTRDGGWQPLVSNPGRWMQLSMLAAGHHVGNLAELQALFDEFKANQFPSFLGGAPLPLRFVLLDATQHLLIGSPRKSTRLREWPIRHDGRVVGFLGVPQNRPTPYDRQFQHRFLTGLAATIVVIVLLAMLPAMFIARKVTQPVRAIGRAARSLAAGHTSRVLEVCSRDELGDLARDFNELSAALARSRHQQRQWLAEISHELRTPVANVMAEAEAVIDGLRPPSKISFESLHEECARLSRLIGDLHELSLLDGGMARMCRTEIQLTDLLGGCVAALQTRFDLRDIRVQLSTSAASEAGMRIVGDPDKLRRVFMNLLENSLAYTDPGGAVHIGAARVGDTIVVSYEDSSPGVTSQEVPHLFERLYRGDASRNRRSGGAGLGLSIVQSIVHAHGGSVAATQSTLGGLRFELRFSAVV